MDVLLAARDPRDRRKIAAAHAFLHMHPESGAWMIRAGQTCSHNVQKPGDAVVITDPEGFKNCTHSPVYYDGEPIKHSGFRPISRSSTTIALGGMQFNVKVCIQNSEDEKSYVQDRNIWLEALGMSVPVSGVSGLPFESDLWTKTAVFRRGPGWGTLGSSSKGSIHERVISVQSKDFPLSHSINGKQ